MIERLLLRNFRGFSRHELPLRTLSIVVGKNNAGKSTIVEALRLVSVVTSRFTKLTYRRSPPWTNLPARDYGVTPSLKGLDVNFDSIFHRYEPPPAVLEAVFANGSRVVIHIVSEDKVFVVVKDKDGSVVKSRGDAAKAALPIVGIMPQVAPVAREETVLSPEHVRRSVSSNLSSAHFRNQLSVFYELLPSFQCLVEESWPGVKVLDLMGRSRIPGKGLYLHVRNEDFVAEVGAMGHGLQMWLQTMWFLTRSQKSQTIILDEPDVYMHPDLQRRIVRFLRNRFQQTIITTHSVEILSEVDPEEVLVIDRRRPRSKFMDSVPSVQRLANSIGSAHNLHLARLWYARRFILVEGKDLGLLKQFQNLLFPESTVPIDSLPNMTIGGWGGWNYAVGSALVMKNAFGESIVVYCILDSDYHTESAIRGRKDEAAERGVSLHIWSKKEIENYLLVPDAIQRFIAQRVPRRTSPPSKDEVESRLQEEAASLVEECFDGLAAEMLAGNRSLGSGGANKRAREALNRRRESTGLLSMVSGKSVLSRVSSWSQQEFGVAIVPMSLARCIQMSELSGEVIDVVTAIEHGEEFADVNG